MIINGTTSATWAHGFAGLLPSAVFDGRAITQDPDASRANPVYPAQADGEYTLNGDKVDLSIITDFFSLPDGADTYDAQDGTLTRGVGKKVFDGTESWTQHANGTFYTSIADMKSGNDMAGVFSHGVHSTSTSHEGVKFGNNNHSLYWYGISDYYATVPDLQTYLAAQYANGTPVTAYYPLATETTSTITAQPLTAVLGANSITLTSGSAVNFTLNVSAVEDYPFITDRSAHDQAEWQILRDKIITRAASQDEWDEWNAGMRYCINATDLNRYGLYLDFIEDVYTGGISLVAKQDWTRGKVALSDAINLANDIITVRNTLPVPAETPTITPFGLYALTGGLNLLTPAIANNIELILQAAIAVL